MCVQCVDRCCLTGVGGGDECCLVAGGGGGLGRVLNGLVISGKENAN